MFPNIYNDPLSVQRRDYLSFATGHAFGGWKVLEKIISAPSSLTTRKMVLPGDDLIDINANLAINAVTASVVFISVLIIGYFAQLKADFDESRRIESEMLRVRAYKEVISVTCSQPDMHVFDFCPCFMHQNMYFDAVSSALKTIEDPNVGPSIKDNLVRMIDSVQSVFEDDF